MQLQDDVRLTGKFPVQQAKVLEDFIEARFHGRAVSRKFLRRSMKKHCNEDMPQGYDPAKDKFTNQWCRKFMKRHGLSMRKRTNKKKECIWKRMHKIKNFHHFTVFRLPDMDISDEEEESSDSTSEDVTDGESSDSSSEESSTDESDSDSSSEED